MFGNKCSLKVTYVYNNSTENGVEELQSETKWNVKSIP